MTDKFDSYSNTLDVADGVAVSEVLDRDWIRQSLFLPGRSGTAGSARTKETLRSQQFTGASLTFADTSLGGNRSMNPYPQFTKNCDPNVNSLITGISPDANLSTRARSMGMGMYYAEGVDNQSIRLSLQFGVPEYNSLTTFFGMYYDRDASRLANTGKSASILSTVAKYVSYVVLWEFHAIQALVNFTSDAINFMKNKPMYKFYYMNPTMDLYWTSVSTIVNGLTTSMNMNVGAGTDAEATKVDADAKAFSKLLPSVMLADGGFDVKSIANRYQRLADAHSRKLAALVEANKTEADLTAALEAFYVEGGSNIETDDKLSGLHDGLKDYLASGGQSSSGNVPMDEGSWWGDVKASTPPAGNDVVDAIGGSNTVPSTKSLYTGIADWFSGPMASHLLANARSGNQLVTFTVDNPGSYGDSWSSNTKSSSIADTMNSKSNANRSRLHNIAGGNIGSNIIADTMEAIGKGLADIAGGVLESFGLQGIEALGGSAQVDMPDFWDNSSTSLASSSYTMQLRSPYGNDVSIMTNILIPLAMLLAGALPRSTGRASYTSPFLCSSFCTGRERIDLGMITALSITRGVGNMGLSDDNKPVAIDVSFTITNLEKMMHVPISTTLGTFGRIGESLVSEDNNFTRYIHTLAGLGYAEQTYVSNKFRRNIANLSREFNSTFSTSNIASKVFEWAPGRLIRGLSSGSSL